MSEKGKLRYVERYWSAAELEKAKFRAAAICRYLRQCDNYQPNPAIACRLRLEQKNRKRPQHMITTGGTA